MGMRKLGMTKGTSALGPSASDPERTMGILLSSSIGGDLVFQFRNLFASLLIGILSLPAVASDGPAVLVAALDVVSTNSRGGHICEGVAPNPSRSDRLKLAKLVAALPNPNAKYPFGYTDITPLGLAVLADDVGLLESLFAKGAQCRKDSFDSTAIYEAAQHGSPAMIKAIHEAWSRRGCTS